VKSLGDKIIEPVTCIRSIAINGIIYKISEVVKAQLQLQVNAFVLSDFSSMPIIQFLGSDSWYVSGT
jgi:hypothetical protein